MKKILTLLMTVTVLLALTLPASADILWEPMGNGFYDAHREECTYHGRGYTANGAEGYITLWDAPNGMMVKEQFENGQSLWVYWVWENWGLVSPRVGEKNVDGWVDLDEMSLVYDHISFELDYGESITDYRGEFADYAGEDQVFNFYEYPGAGQVKREMKLSYGSVVENLTGGENGESYIRSVFVDENGLRWGYVGYMYGRLDGWFCMDDPDGTPESFADREVAEEVLVAPQPPRLPARGYLPYALVGGVAAVTVGLLVVFFRKKG